MANVSVVPTSFVSESGLFSEGDYEITGLKYVEFDYNGKAAEATPALHLEAQNLDDADVTVDQYYSCGKLADFMPSPDGKTLIAVGKKSALNKSTNAAILFTEMQNAGVPTDLMVKMGDDVSVMEGARLHFIPFDVAYKDKDKKEQKRTLFIPNRVISLPGEAEAAATAQEQDDLAEIAVRVMEVLLEEGKGKLKRAEIPAKVMSKNLGDDEGKKMEVVQMLFNEDFLKANFSLAGGVVSKK